MKQNQKRSRVDRLELQMEAVGNALQNMDQAIRWSIQEIKELKGEPMEKGDPNQLKLDLEDEKEEKEEGKLL